MISVEHLFIQFVKYGGILSIPLSLFNTWYNILYQNKKIIDFEIDYKKSIPQKGQNVDELYIYIINKSQKSINIKSINIKDNFKGKIIFSSLLDGEEYKLFSEVKSGFVVVCKLRARENILEHRAYTDSYIRDIGHGVCLEFHKNKVKRNRVIFDINISIEITSGKKFNKAFRIAKDFSEITYDAKTLSKHIEETKELVRLYGTMPDLFE